MSTFSFKTIGCRLNQAETAAMRAAAAVHGGQIVKFGDPCDICIIHGCVVTRRAETDTLRAAPLMRQHNLARKVVIAGCAAEFFLKNDIKTAADLLLPQAEKFDFDALLRKLKLHDSSEDLLRLPEAITKQNTSTAAEYGCLPIFETTRALVRVQSGCDFCCAYCIVPQVRGAPQSRPMPEIITEIKQLEAAGYNEIVLTGANLGCYQADGAGLMQLLHAILARTAIPRIRLSSIELSTVEREVIDCMAGDDRLCRFLHLPLQSGSDEILKKMRRRYTRDDYARVVEYAVKKLGQPGIGADVIVGFPGETEADFRETVHLIEALPLTRLHVFPYSPRLGTAAADLGDQIPESTKQARAKELLQISQHKQKNFARQWIGKPVEVLIEKKERRAGTAKAEGWTGEYIPARLARTAAVNSIVQGIPHAVQDGILLI